MHATARTRVTELGDAPALPRLNAVAVHALNRLYLRGAEAAVVTLREQPMRVQWDAQACPLQFERYRFRVGAHSGSLGLDSALQAMLLDERRFDLLPRELRQVLLADALRPVVELLEKALRMRFEWAPEEDAAADRAEDGRHAACFALKGLDSDERYQGFVQFDDPAALDAFVPRSVRPAPGLPRELDFLRLPLGFCLGTTQIRLREVRSVRPGDIISLEAWDSAGAGLVVTARFGLRQLVGKAEGTRITLQQIKDLPMDRDAFAAAPALDDAEGAPPVDRLDALEMTLRFEVGDLSLSLGELKAIRAGHVFELGQPLNRTTVRILAHGNVLGKGHLVAVGDQLGVRVSEFAPTEI
jgi:type III secretion protein Q